VTTTAPTLHRPDTADLHVRSLPKWSTPVLIVGSIVVMLGIFAVTPWQGRADYLVATALFYVIAQTVASAVVEGRRKAKDRFAFTAFVASMVAAVIPLLAVLGYTIVRGAKRFDADFLTHSLRNVAASDPGGGAYAAIIGTLQQVLIATLIAVPLGLLVSIYLVEYSKGGRYARLVSTFVDVMTGLPSIVAGLFVLAFWILALHQNFSGFAGALALFVIMLPVVVRSSEEMLRLVPDSLREASYALGLPRWRTILSVVLPTALPGLTTGVMLAIARIAGESAPLLLVIFGNPAINNNPFSGPQDGLPLFVFSQAGLPNDTAVDRAWAGALTLILIVVALNVVARLLTRRSSLNHR
jgi:phosphate transport system permease protein